MRYKVIVRFIDLKDNNHVYNVGDDYPRVGKDVSEVRINELKSSNNKRGIPLIAEEVDEAHVETEAETVETVETDVSEEPTPQKTTSRKNKK